MTLTAASDEHDIVEIILQRCTDAGLDIAVARSIGAQIRALYGGLRFRIPKRHKQHTAAARADAYADGMTSMSTAEITTKHGISRSTLYRLMKRGSP